MAVVRSHRVVAFSMCGAFFATLILGVGLLVALGTGERGLRAALLATARFQFLLFWPAYTGSALTCLFGPAFQPLKQNVREFGLAFSSALLVHLALVGVLCLTIGAPAVGVFVFFGIAAAWAYLLALFSIPRLHQMLPPKYWRLLNIIGMNYLGCAFFVDFWKEPFYGGIKHVITYLPFAVLAIAGPSLRVAAFVQRTYVERFASTSNGEAERRSSHSKT